MQIIEKFATRNPYYKNNVKRVDSRYTKFQSGNIAGIMLHGVGCPQPKASVFADSWNRENAEVICNAVLQADGTVYQTMPWNFRSIHAGSPANDLYISVEMTEPACIKYKYADVFDCSDFAAARAHAEGCYKTARDLFAYLCDKFNFDPMTQILSHAEGAKRGVATNHSDPEHLWRQLGMSYTMDGFRKDVAAKLAEMRKPEPVEVVPEIIEKDEKKEEEKKMEKRFYLVSDIPAYAKPTIDKLIACGVINGKGKNDAGEIILDMGEDAVRLLVILDRAGVFAQPEPDAEV